MERKPIAQRISEALQEGVYELSAQVCQVIEDVTDAVVDAAAQVEKQVTPEYKINVDVDKDADPKVVAQSIIDDLSRAPRGSAREAGGSENPSLNSTLNTVYEYMNNEGSLKDTYMEKKTKDEVLTNYRHALAVMFTKHVDEVVYEEIKAKRVTD